MLINQSNNNPYGFIKKNPDLSFLQSKMKSFLESDFSDLTNEERKEMRKEVGWNLKMNIQKSKEI